MKGIGRYFSLVKFSHSIFALPFALQGAWIAGGGTPDLLQLALVVAAAVCARTAAMGFNRLVDRRLDAANPRTVLREIPAGIVSAGGVLALVLVSAVLFVLLAYLLSPLCGHLSFPVLCVLLGYSLVKRVSFLAHAALGLALGLAPLGAWLAIQGDFASRTAGELPAVCWLSAGVLLWVAGFDLIYACQDAEHDRRVGLHSVPARFGIRAALNVSSALHVVALCCFGMQAFMLDAGPYYWAGIALAVVLLLWEHRIVAPGDLSRVDAAFFTINGWVGVGLFVSLALDYAARGGPA